MAFPPSNVDLASLTPGPAPGALTLDCSIELNTDTPELADWCGGGAPTTQVISQMINGPETLVILSEDLTLGASAEIDVRGSRPVIFLAFGTANIAGKISASAQGANSGAGANIDCGPANGLIGESTTQGGLGGGGAGGSRRGSMGGGAGQSPAGPAAVNPRERLIPLTGGCLGGIGGNGGDGPTSAGGYGGGGGGALQIWAMSQLALGNQAILAAGGGGGGGGQGQTNSGGGGGGGGAGGAILLEAQTVTVSPSAFIVANGGGGGAGGASGVSSNGGNGEDGRDDLIDAAGGDSFFAGTGGGGGVSNRRADDGGAQGLNGDGTGGGGGALGHVRINVFSHDPDVQFGTMPNISPSPTTNRRTYDGLVALYRFNAGRGVAVYDLSEHQAPIDLSLQPSIAEAATWGLGEISITARTSIVDDSPDVVGDRIRNECLLTSALSVEAWVNPSQQNANGPDRLVSYSTNTTHRAFTLGHGGDGGNNTDLVQLRIRTETPGGPLEENGSPYARVENLGEAVENLVHVVFTYDGSAAGDGALAGYVNGIPQTLDFWPGPVPAHAGGFATWAATDRLVLANELDDSSGLRSFTGVFHLAAIYCSALSAEQVAQHYIAGP